MLGRGEDLAVATVYVPTLLAGPELEACLLSLETQTVPIQVVVVDNGEGNGCAELIDSSFPWVERIGFGRNLGFGPALNLAIAQTGSGPIILLNDDATADPEFVASLVKEGERAEMVAAVLTSREDPAVIASAGILVDQTLMAFDFLSGETIERLDSCGDPIGPTGGGCLYAREAFEAVGGFDDRIFLYYEDVDLALRIRSNGGRCRLAANARACHAYSGTLGAGSPRKYAMTGWSRGYLLRRYGILRNPRLLPGLIARELVVCTGQLVRGRTFSGLLGRIRGWRAAGGLPLRKLPGESVTHLSALEALRRRSQGP
jgi:GT2 family glycosyltransferase